MALEAPARLLSWASNRLPSFPSAKPKASWFTIKFTSSPDVALLMLAMLVYAMFQYVKLAHSVLQRTSVPSLVEGVKTAAAAMKTEEHPERRIKIKRPICETKAEDLLVHCEDDVRHEKHCPTVAIKPGEEPPITPPKSPHANQHSEICETDCSKEEILSSTDCADHDGISP